MTKKLISTLLSLCMVVTLLPTVVWATGNDLVVTKDGGSPYTYTDDLLTISEGGQYVITMADGVTSTKDHIEVTTSDDVTIKLKGVNINTDGASGAALKLSGSGTVTLQLAEENTLESGDTQAGIQQDNASAQLIITSAAGDGSTSGTLNAIGGGAGIGGYSTIMAGYTGGNGGNVTINGGTITATGYFGAGIGGGYGDGNGGNGGNVTINGGSVTATSDFGGAGIGGGYGNGNSGIGGNGGNVTINGGTVNASSLNDSGGAGIGSGKGKSDSGKGGSVTIKGGTVTASGSLDCSGIGDPEHPGTLTVSPPTGRQITVTAGMNQAAAGRVQGSPFAAETDITRITMDYSYFHSEVSAMSNGLDVIGDPNGYTYENDVVTITGGGAYTIQMPTGVTTTTDQIKVTASDDVTITLNGVNINTPYEAAMELAGSRSVTLKLAGENTLKTQSSNAGIQQDNADSKLIITSAAGDGSTDGTLNVTGGGAGIGGYANNAGNGGYSTMVTIKGGTVTATGEHGAGIGGGAGTESGGNCQSVTIDGGMVTAIGQEGAGIGGGAGSQSGGNCNTIEINGGSVTATGTGGAGIGGGGGTESGGKSGHVTIKAGTVVATSNNQGAGIGEGYGLTNGTSNNISIKGGIVTATGNTAGVNADQIPISPQRGKLIKVSAGDSEDSATEIDGSPFGYTAPKNVASSVSNRKYFHSEEITLGLKVTGDNYTYKNGVVNITGGGEYTIEMPEGITTTTDRIEVNTSEDVTITLKGVNIDTSDSAIKLAGSGSVTLKLADENNLNSQGSAGIQYQNTDAQLYITSAAGDGSTDGILNVTGAGAGIGGVANSTISNGSNGGDITISGGTINATGNNGAGIGGGNGRAYGGNGGDVTINGGKVTAIGNKAAGIGGGTGMSTSGGNGGSFEMNGGIVIATGIIGAGIGGGTGGTYGGDCGNVTINGGTLTATSKEYGCDGIGQGYGMHNRATNTEVSINGGTVTADGKHLGINAKELDVNPNRQRIKVVAGSSEANATEIPGSPFAETKNITSDVSSSKYFHSEGLPNLIVTGDPNGYTYENGVVTITGGGEYTIQMADGVTTTTDCIYVTSPEAVTITLNGVNIKTEDYCAAMELAGDGAVTLKLAGENKLQSTAYKAGIQQDNKEAPLFIESASEDSTSTDGRLTAIGGHGSAGIGGCGIEMMTDNGNNGGNVTINGGTIIAEGDPECAAGIGGGLDGKGGTVCIHNGMVTATGNIGIGGGASSSDTPNPNGGKLVVYGGTVTAVGEAAGVSSNTELIAYPIVGNQIEVKVGDNEANATTAQGSPFTEPTTITDFATNYHYFHSETSIIPIYSISASPSSLNFDSKPYGDTTSNAQTITITNNGNQNVVLKQPTATNYEIGALSQTLLAPGETATFTVRPKNGLVVNNYPETLTVLAEYEEPIITGPLSQQSITANQEAASTQIALNFTVIKAPQNPPDAPTLKDRTTSSITLDVIPDNENGAKAQYSIDGGNTWQDSNRFDNLSPDTEYSFVARYTETDNYEASPASEPSKFSTLSDSKPEPIVPNEPKPNDNNNNSGAPSTTDNNADSTSSDDNPKTGDNDFAAWFGLLLLSGFTSIGTIIGKRKKRRSAK